MSSIIVKNNTALRFSEEDGVTDNGFCIKSKFKTNAGELFFGGVNGYTSFMPNDIKLNQTKPKIVITDFSIYNKTVDLEKNISGLDKIEIKHNQNYLTFKFAALSFKNAQKNQYAYKLEGFDEDWIYCGNKKHATYTNLDGGEYTFKVKGSNNDGVWNEAGTSIQLIVHPPFWETSWFRFLMALLAIGFIYALIKMRTYNLLRKSQDLKEYNEALSGEIQTRKRVEKSLKEREELLSLIINNIPQSIYWKDKENKYLGCNKNFADLVNIEDNKNIIGKTTCELNNNVNFETFCKNKDGAILETGEGVYNQLEKIPAENGKGKWLQSNKIPLKTDEGIIGLVGTIEDVTEKKIAEKALQEYSGKLEEIVEELKRSNQDLEQFAYIASHDLKEPIRTIGSFVKLIELQYNEKLDDTGREYIHYTVDGVNRMSNLISSLLAYSKVASSNENYKIANLAKIVELKILDLNTRIKESKAQIKVDPLPNNLYCAPGELGMVFYNLINNAIKFNTKETPTVKVGVEEDEQFWTFSIKDNGIGIKEEDQNKIFELFKRLHNKQQFEGSGIGLSICRRIINRHGGEIWLESEIGQGTTFYFNIRKDLIITKQAQQSKHKNVFNLEKVA